MTREKRHFQTVQNTDEFEEHANWIRLLRAEEKMSSLTVSQNGQGTSRVLLSTQPPLVKRQKCMEKQETEMEKRVIETQNYSDQLSKL